MSALLDRLRDLQEVDTELAALEKARRENPEKAEEGKRHLDGLKEELARKRSALRELQKTSGIKELDLKTHDEKVKKLKKQLLTVKTNREYSALLLEIGGEEADNSRLEDEILELMTQAEELEAQCKEDAEKIAQEEKRLEAELEKIQAELREIEQRIAELSKLRMEKAQDIDGEALVLYEKIWRAKGDRALVPVSGTACQGCFMNITMENLSRLMADRELITCESCGRILYLDKKEEDE
jgi:hypothetical protein